MLSRLVCFMTTIFDLVSSSCLAKSKSTPFIFLPGVIEISNGFIHKADVVKRRPNHHQKYVN